MKCDNCGADDATQAFPTGDVYFCDIDCGLDRLSTDGKAPERPSESSE